MEETQQDLSKYKALFDDKVPQFKIKIILKKDGFTAAEANEIYDQLKNPPPPPAAPPAAAKPKKKWSKPAPPPGKLPGGAGKPPPPPAANRVKKPSSAKPPPPKNGQGKPKSMAKVELPNLEPKKLNEPRKLSRSVPQKSNTQLTSRTGSKKSVGSMSQNNRPAPTKGKNPMFAKMHASLNQQMGGGSSTPPPPPDPEPRRKSIPKKFNQIHSKLGAMFGIPEKPAEKPAAAKKPKKIPKMKRVKKELKVLDFNDPTYDKYKKMKKMRLAEGAIAQKLESDGLDPDAFFKMLQNPPAAAKPAAAMAPAPAPVAAQPAAAAPVAAGAPVAAQPAAPAAAAASPVGGQSSNRVDLEQMQHQFMSLMQTNTMNQNTQMQMMQMMGNMMTLMQNMQNQQATLTRQQTQSHLAAQSQYPTMHSTRSVHQYPTMHSSRSVHQYPVPPPVRPQMPSYASEYKAHSVRSQHMYIDPVVPRSERVQSYRPSSPPSLAGSRQSLPQGYAPPGLEVHQTHAENPLFGRKSTGRGRGRRAAKSDIPKGRYGAPIDVQTYLEAQNPAPPVINVFYNANEDDVDLLEIDDVDSRKDDFMELEVENPHHNDGSDDVFSNAKYLNVNVSSRTLRSKKPNYSSTLERRKRNQAGMNGLQRSNSSRSVKSSASMRRQISQQSSNVFEEVHHPQSHKSYSSPPPPPPPPPEFESSQMAELADML